MDDIERVATRRSLRNPKKTLKGSQFDRERVENAWESGDDVIEVEPALPRTPRPNRVRGKSNPTTTTTATATLNDPRAKAGTTRKVQISTADLGRRDEPESNNGLTNQIIDELRTNNRQLKTNNDQLQKEMAELRTFTKDLMEELTSIKTQLSDVTQQLSSVTKTASSLSQLATMVQNCTPSSASSPGNASSRTYASVLANSVDPSSSASQHHALSDASQSRNPVPGVTVDTRRARDKSKIVDATEMEGHIREKIQEIPEVADIAVTGIQIRGHHVRVLTRTEEDAALLRTHDQWVNQAFEGARTRGEDWHAVKLDDVVKVVVLQEDGRTVREEFAGSFCAANGLTGVKKAFWLSKGDRVAGLMVVYLASATEAQAILKQRTVKIEGQIAFTKEFHKLPRPVRCYNCNQYGHYQSRCSQATTCGQCAQNHRTDSCTTGEKKCAACGEAHAVIDRGCPVYKRERTRLQQGGDRYRELSQPRHQHA